MLLMSLIGCALKSITLPPPKAEVRRWTEQVDWQATTEEATQILSDYLQVDTVNPPGNESNGTAFLANILAKEGIAHEIIPLSPNRSNLIARLPGTGEDKPLCLLSHIDVVTSEEDKWTYPPLSGRIADGYVWGRGALDMKGMGVMELMSMLLLHRLQVPLKREVIFLAVADEEVEGSGIKDLIANHWDKLNCGHLINEGGLGLKGAFFPEQTAYVISVGEKGSVWLKMKAFGEAGHGSTPRPNEAPVRLIAAINALQNRDVKVEIHPAVRQLLTQIGHAKGGVAGHVMSVPFLTSWLVTPKLMSNPLTRASITNTVHLTGMGGANKPNVVPSEVYALLDCRILPGVDPDDFIAGLQEIVGPEIEFEVISSQAGNASPVADPLYHALARYAVMDDPQAAVGPAISVGFTDSIHVRPKGTFAYGFMPIVATDKDMEGFHGANEKLSIRNLHDGTKKLFHAIVEVSVR